MRLFVKITINVEGMVGKMNKVYRPLFSSQYLCDCCDRILENEPNLLGSALWEKIKGEIYSVWNDAHTDGEHSGYKCARNDIMGFLRRNGYKNAADAIFNEMFGEQDV